jgi:pSer/pThr/pTyr-binding forkhead associated (FHA) protein
MSEQDLNEIKILGERMSSYRFRDDHVTVGRSSRNHIVIRDPSVSRVHCIIVREISGRYRLIDLASACGTFVNGARVKSRVIGPEDAIKVGSTVLFFHLSREKLERCMDKKAGSRSVPEADGDADTDFGSVDADAEEFEAP